MARSRSNLPELKAIQSVQLTLDLPQFRIKPGTRVLVISGNLSGKTGRVLLWHIDHIVSFAGGKIKSIPRHLLVEIKG